MNRLGHFVTEKNPQAHARGLTPSREGGDFATRALVTISPKRFTSMRADVIVPPNAEVDVFSGLLVEYTQRRGANVILRGIRAISDYEYELQMAMMNRKLEPNVETVFMMPAEAYSYLSSRLVREIAFAL